MKINIDPTQMISMIEGWGLFTWTTFIWNEQNPSIRATFGWLTPAIVFTWQYPVQCNRDLWFRRCWNIVIEEARGNRTESSQVDASSRLDGCRRLVGWLVGRSAGNPRSRLTGIHFFCGALFFSCSSVGLIVWSQDAARATITILDGQNELQEVLNSRTGSLLNTMRILVNNRPVATVQVSFAERGK